jgi:hypothetical protein
LFCLAAAIWNRTIPAHIRGRTAALPGFRRYREKTGSI